jgi:hypothetical protein
LLSAVVCVLALPALEFIVLAKEQLEGLAHDARSVRVDELGVLIQVLSDFFVLADLKSHSFWLFRWCFQECQVFLLLSLFVMQYSLHYELLSRLLHAGKTRLGLPRDGWERSHGILDG